MNRPAVMLITSCAENQVLPAFIVTRANPAFSCLCSPQLLPHFRKTPRFAASSSLHPAYKKHRSPSNTFRIKFTSSFELHLSHLIHLALLDPKLINLHLRLTKMPSAWNDSRDRRLLLAMFAANKSVIKLDYTKLAALCGGTTKSGTDHRFRILKTEMQEILAALVPSLSSCNRTATASDCCFSVMRKEQGHRLRPSHHARIKVMGKVQ